MSPHTPGPWVVDVTRARRRGPITMLMIVAEAGGMPGLIVNIGATVEPRDIANATLIAAAPDLLAALEALIPMVEEFAVNPELDTARAAVKKARGEA